ncbi:MAG: hypothetical protein IJZ08_09215 [Clostridia bacterium]|nr:hypothetical protein [Clostridia bacterium]
MNYRIGLEKFEDPKSHNAALAGEYANNYTEYTVAQKAEGKNLTNRLLLILLYTVYSVVFAVFFLAGPVKIPMLVALLPVTLWIIIFFTWRFVSVEHEYMLASGVMTFVDIYGGRKRKALFACPVKEMREIAPLRPTTQLNAKTVIDMRGSVKSADSYYFIINDRDGESAAVLFEATSKAVQIMKYYNSATVTSDSLAK